jgi:hypothetical protein
MSSAVARNKSQPEEPLDPEGEKKLVDELSASPILPNFGLTTNGRATECKVRKESHLIFTIVRV